MAQLHFYLPAELVEKVRERARTYGLSVSRYIAEIVKRELVDDWPDGFFEETAGGWKGEPLERPSQGKHESREEL